MALFFRQKGKRTTNVLVQRRKGQKETEEGTNLLQRIRFFGPDEFFFVALYLILKMLHILIHYFNWFGLVLVLFILLDSKPRFHRFFLLICSIYVLCCLLSKDFFFLFYVHHFLFLLGEGEALRFR